jgi:mycothiol synthase
VNIRPFDEGDAAAVAALVNRDEEAFYNRPGRVTGADILMYGTYAKEQWVYEEDGRIVAASEYGVHGDSATIHGFVADKGRGIGTQIAQRGEEFARAHAMAKVHANFAEPDTAARRLFESRGYREVRRFWEMVIELTEEPTVPALPDGLMLDELHEGEERAFYDATNDAFQDHWEWHPRPFDEWMKMRRGRHRDERGPVWFLIRDGDELAAVIRNDANVQGGGHVGVVGVRPGWRGKGLAKVLLYRTFLEFWRRGTLRVSLEVDSQNDSGAVQLYEHVGMHVDACAVVMEKA